MGDMDTTASNYADVKMEELVIRLMGGVHVLLVGKVHSAISAHVHDLNYMDLIVP